MRLRNLYEVQIQPGERRGFSLRLKKLEDLQLKVAEMQNTIANLKGTSVPDVLKKQMQDLIDTANMEKEKLYSEFDNVSPSPSVEGIPGNVLKLLQGIEKNSSIIMNAYRQTGKFLFRGIKSDEEALYGKPFDERRAKDSNRKLSDILNNALASQGFDARRDNTTFTSGSRDQASNYGTVYIVFPRDGFTFHYSKNVRDLVLDASKLNMLMDNDLVKQISDMIRANWDKVNAYFPHKYESDKFFLDYDYEKDVQGLQKAVEAGILPKELEKYKSVEDFVDDAKVIQYFDYDQTDIVGAINSGHEVMVRGPYYALRSNKFEQYIKKYLELTANGPIKSPPRVTKKKDDDVTNALGKESDGLEVGVQVKHKYEPIFGEIVNTFFTNDFVQVKNYDGNTMLVKKSNIEKLSPDDIPKYEKGDKVIINTQNTAMDYLHNKKAKVVSTNGLTITVSYGSYGDTVDLPIFFVKPGVKYSTDNPEVGDSVKVTKGEFAGEYGTIVHVSYYGKDIDVDFGDGESEAISQGYYEVVDPKTVPDNTDKQKFEIGDRVKVDSDGEKMSGYVGIVKKPGAVKTSVRIFGGTHVHPTQSIKNSRLNPVSEQDYEKQNFYHNAPVIAVSGKHRGKSGKVSYFMSNGNIEVTMDTGGYFETSIDNLVLVDKYTGKLDPNKGPKEKPEDPDKLKKGDTVLVLYGKHASKIGTINHIYLSGDTAEVRFDDDSYADIATSGLQKTDKSDDNIKDDDLIDLVDLDFEPLDEPTTATGQPKTDKGKFKVGDKVKITSGPEKGKTGEINYIYTYDNTAYIKSGDNYYDIALKDLEVDNGETDKEFDVNALNFMVGDEANATNPNAVKKLWTVDSIGSDHVILQNKSTGGTIKLPMEKFYASNPEYAPDANKFEDGDMVTVTTGPFKDFEGKVIGAGNEKDEKMLVINIFGKDNNVSIAKNYLKKISTPQTKVGQKATVLDPENKAELLELFKDKDIKVIMRKAIADKYISYDDQLDLSNASDLKYYTTLLPYLQLKGVKLL